MVRVDHLDFKYAHADILSQVTLDSSPGECMSIVGPNGAGKSTLVKCIVGLLAPRNGRVKIDGENLADMKRMKIAQKVGYVPQSQSSLFPIRVFDMVLLGRRPHLSWKSSDNDLVKAMKSLVILKIENLAMKNFNEISGGQQQKVIIARALAQETEILLLDEPISNLDIKHQLEVMTLLRELSKKHRITSIIVVHDLNIAARFSDKIVMMKSGQVVTHGTPEKVFTKENIRNVYDVEVEIVYVKNKLHIIPLKASDGQSAEAIRI